MSIDVELAALRADIAEQVRLLSEAADRLDRLVAARQDSTDN